MSNFMSSYLPPHQPADTAASTVPSPYNTSPYNNTSTYQCYPFLTNEEFAEVCHYLDAKYCQAHLGPLRKQWRLNLHTALDTTATSHADLLTFLQITKPLEINEADDELASRLGNVALNESSVPTRRSTRQSMRQSAADSMMISMEEADQEVLRYRSRASFQSSYVVYEIHLHPTYRAPCLWFSLHNLPIDESPLDIESVFRHLMPDHFKHGLREQQGAVGGISIDHHPITGVPTFFVHPCILGDIMAHFGCSKEDYLTVWIGTVGELVGLRVPMEMASGSRGSASQP
ncbi:hypothetical protein E0Z10_g6046 [Xylaria hypoxylon]|uniref:Ubiquitin-like-conjugating enzyme ATG10 n=1 Tax=Xylaria hypoxylon TaxID=37992 RepID=A0A4Z0YTJ7_9PEZI|nr:hypothetical protein E0Z10_g6046 [Xylaria hypoxylon]